MGRQITIEEEIKRQERRARLRIHTPVCGYTVAEITDILNENYLKNEEKTKINAPKKRR